MSENVDLDGRTIFITGGARGIGLGIALASAARGAKLGIADVDANALEQARGWLEPVAEVRTYRLDVTDRDAFVGLADEVEADLGPVFGLYNNAGIIDSVPVAKMKGETWDWIVDVNLHGVYNGLQAFLPRMIQRKEGLVVSTSSMAGMVGASSGFAYCATKFAVVGLSESLRGEVAHHNISVSVIMPGQVATSIVQNTRAARPEEAEKHSERVNQILDFAHNSLLENGTSLEVAGERIVSSAVAGRPYIFTDDTWIDVLRERNERVYASFYAQFPESAGAV